MPANFEGLSEIIQVEGLECLRISDAPSLWVIGIPICYNVLWVVTPNRTSIRSAFLGSLTDSRNVGGNSPHLMHSMRPNKNAYRSWLPTLARCGRSSNAQTWCHHAQMSAWQGSAVPCPLLHTGHRCCRQAASQVSHTATDGGFTTSALHCWTPSFRCARPHGLELPAG